MSIKECIRPVSPRTDDEAKHRIIDDVEHYNEVRLHSAIGYVTPADCPCGHAEEIHAERDRKVEEARALAASALSAAEEGVVQDDA